jgi:hypothetical protein
MMQASTWYRILGFVFLASLAGCVNSIAGPDDTDGGSDNADDPTPPSAWLRPAGGEGSLLG